MTDIAHSGGSGVAGSRPVLSVCVVTYNHSKYVAQALDSILMQETSFDFEICVGDDGSTDGTTEICRRYAEAHPGQIRHFVRDRKDMIRIDGRETGRFNYLETLRACRGQYVACLEGDDFWTDPQKLEKQVRFLEQNRAYSVCAHDVWKHEDGEDAPPQLTFAGPPSGRVIFEQRDFIRTSLLPTGSLVFRNVLGGKEPPAYMRRLNAGDRALLLHLTSFGACYFLCEPMGAYRVHGGGMWSGALSADRLERRRSDWKVVREQFGFIPHEEYLAELGSIGGARAVALLHERGIGAFAGELLSERPLFWRKLGQVLRRFRAAGLERLGRDATQSP